MKPHSASTLAHVENRFGTQSTASSYPEMLGSEDDETLVRIDSGPDVISGVFGQATPVLAEAIPQSSRRRDQHIKLLKQAGYLARSAYVDFAAIRYALVICSILVMGTALLVVTPTWEPFVLGGLVTIPFLFWLIPASIVERQASHRNEQIARGIPDFMSVVKLCVEQGMDVPTAFTRAGTELRDVYPAIAIEVALTTVQAEVTTFAHSLRALRDRIDIPEMNTLTSVLIQSSELGTGVCESLEKNSRSLRQLWVERRNTQAKLTPRNIILPTVFFLLPAAIVILNAPAIVEHLSSLDTEIISSQWTR